MLIRTIISIVLIFSSPQAFAAEHKSLRIISLAPSTTEILFALGLEEEIVGVSSFCDYPEKALRKEKVGSFSQPNMEKIISLKPDIIFCTGLEQNIAVTELRRLKFNVFVSDPSNAGELFVSIREIGKLTGKPEQAEALIRNMTKDIKDITDKVKRIRDDKRPAVFIEIWNDPLMTAGKGSYIDELVRLAGGRNIAYDTVRPYCLFSVEQVIKRDPACIIETYMGSSNPAEEIRHRAGWEEISAVKNKRVYNDIDPNLLLRPGPRLALGMKEVYKRLYQ